MTTTHASLNKSTYEYVVLGKIVVFDPRTNKNIEPTDICLAVGSKEHCERKMQNAIDNVGGIDGKRIVRVSTRKNPVPGILNPQAPATT